MFTINKPFLLHAITSVHAGSGSEIGNVDLPIQREKHTAYPKVESSSLKGSLRQNIASSVGNDPVAHADFSVVFGSAPKDTDSNESVASALSFLDARILLFPVKSLKGTFAWITCPHVLQRFNREMTLLNPISADKLGHLLLEVGEPGTVSGSALVAHHKEKNGDEEKLIVLEEYTFKVRQSDKAEQLARKLEDWVLENETPIGITERLVILSDDEFANFVKLSTEVNARIRVEDNGQVDGGLWYEENVPPETIFYSAILIGQVRAPQKSSKASRDGNNDMNRSELKSAQDVQNYVNEHFPTVFQLGGSNTIGRGIMRNIWIKGGNSHE
ncbi:type III-B CRISPR module RAMP protein Cmr4 [Paenibacillus sp. FSL L8-0638]|uniref:type III-B CRISPR module RAMP protein Cmr4 n=1 Tax=Paenibacillus TaxID=44249 RepID=UPI0031587022